MVSAIRKRAAHLPVLTFNDRKGARLEIPVREFEVSQDGISLPESPALYAGGRKAPRKEVGSPHHSDFQGQKRREMKKSKAKCLNRAKRRIQPVI